VAGTVAACVVAYLRGARIVRVHDVAPVARALALAHAVEGAGIDGAPFVGAVNRETSA
jgi:dihydropteroate synthase